MKKILKMIPELFFIGLGISWAIENYLASGTVNYVALLVVWLMFLQLIYKNRIAGLSYGTALGLFSVYMVMASVSEFNQFDGFNKESAQFLLIWVGFFWFSFAMAAGMLYNYAKAKTGYSENVLTITY